MSANQNSKKDSKNVKTLFSIVCLCIIALGLIVYFSTNSKAQKGTVNENTTIVDTTEANRAVTAKEPKTQKQTTAASHNNGKKRGCHHGAGQKQYSI